MLYMYIYMVTWIPSIYPLYVSIYIPAPWFRHGKGIAHGPGQQVPSQQAMTAKESRMG